MPARSEKQQQFMGIVHAIQKGTMNAMKASPAARRAAREMEPGDVTEFASTKHKGLPVRKHKKHKRRVTKHHRRVTRRAA